MPARVAELVDARDLKSLGYFTCAGSIPAVDARDLKSLGYFTCAGSIPASGIKLSLPYGRLFMLWYYICCCLINIKTIVKIMMIMYYGGIIQ